MQEAWVTYIYKLHNNPIFVCIGVETGIQIVRFQIDIEGVCANSYLYIVSQDIAALLGFCQIVI